MSTRNRSISRAFIGLVVLTFAGSARADLPRPNGNETCPAGYMAKGNICKAGSSAKPGMYQPEGSCPAGHFRQGHYCMKTG